MDNLSKMLFIMYVDHLRTVQSFVPYLNKSHAVHTWDRSIITDRVVLEHTLLKTAFIVLEITDIPPVVCDSKGIQALSLIDSIRAVVSNI